MATKQHGVVSSRQLDRLGYSPSSAAKAAKVGRLRRVHRGVYAAGHEPLTWQGRCMAAVLAVRPAVASHFSAAWLWGLLRDRPEEIHVTASSPRRCRRDFRLHSAGLTAVDITAIEGIPATSLARTLLDLAAVLSSARLERMLERAEELRVFDLRPTEAAIARYSGHSGAGKLLGPRAFRGRARRL